MKIAVDGEGMHDIGITQGSHIESRIQHRRKECEEGRNTSIPNGTVCPREFDGWSCVEETKIGTSANFSCPDFIIGFDRNRTAYRPCLEDGTWFRHPESNKTWTNYTTCIDLDDFQLRSTVNFIYKTGYTVSLVALIISLCIFYYFRSLTCTRIQIHKNLFISLVLNNCLWLIWYETVVDDIRVLMENSVWCRVLHLMVNYFMVATYFWMFCEGLYLHTILVVTFLTESRVMGCLYGIGWGIPGVLVALYALCRASSNTLQTMHCWMEESPYLLLLSVPVCFSMIANTFFLINIVRLLLKKLPSVNSGQTNTPHSSIREKSSFKLKNFRKSTLSRNDSQDQSASSGRTKKAVRATLILIPLLGLQYIVTPFRPEPGHSWEHGYQYVSASVTSMQGVCVALLFCFLNGEVISAVQRKYGQCIMSKRRSWQPCSGTTTVSFSRSSLMQHQHSTQPHIQLNQQYVQQPESEVIIPPTTFYQQVENVENQKSVLL